MVEGIREVRDSLDDAVKDVFSFYQNSGERDFAYWVQHERQHGGDAILRAAQMYVERLRLIRAGGADVELYESRGFTTFQMISRVLLEHGVNEADVVSKVREFTNSDAYWDVPSNRISALLWAVIAHRAGHGQRRPPNKGMSNDIDVISTLLPYCDAMFVDGECEALLRNVPKAHAVDYGTRIFSPPRKNDFLDYLRSLEAEAPPELLAEIQQVYGESWPTPFLSIYGEESGSAPEAGG